MMFSPRPQLTEIPALPEHIRAAARQAAIPRDERVAKGSRRRCKREGCTGEVCLCRSWDAALREERARKRAKDLGFKLPSKARHARSLYQAAKTRAKRDRLPFSITIHDIVIPDTCPLLGIPLIRNRGNGPGPNSPSLDKINPALGYVKGNIQIISFMANSMKQNATLEQMEMLVKNWKAQA